MFFIIGINDSTREIPYNQLKICPICGSYGRDQVFYSARELRLFFIPVFSWNKKYMLKRSCCDSVFELKKSLGEDIDNGVHVDIYKEDLRPIFISSKSTCLSCGASVDKNFDYCPSCGGKL